MTALPFPTNAKPAAATNSDGLLSHFHDEHLETENVYHDKVAPRKPV
jgi:hypothetical protein